MAKFKDDHAKETIKVIDEGIEALERAKKCINDDNFNTTFFNVGQAVITLNNHAQYCETLYPEEFSN